MFSPSALPALALLFNAFVWGVSWLPFRALAAHGWHPLWATALIYLAIFTVVLALNRHRALALLRQRGLIALALASGLTNVGFNWGVTLGDVVRVVLLFYLMPLWVVLLAWIFLGERPSGAALARVALALTGVVIVLKTPHTDWPVPTSLPDWLGVAAGFCFALTNILLRRVRHAGGELRAMAMFGGCAMVALLTAALSTGTGLIAPPALASTSWLGWAAVLGVGFVFANICLQFGVVRLTASAASVIMLSEVIFASVSSVTLGAGSLNWRVWAGGALIVLAALWSALSVPRPPAP